MGSRCNPKYICKREAEGDLVIDRRGEGSVTEEAEREIGVIKPQAGRCRQPPAAGRGKEWNPHRESSLADTLISAQ